VLQAASCRPDAPSRPRLFAFRRPGLRADSHQSRRPSTAFLHKALGTSVLLEIQASRLVHRPRGFHNAATMGIANFIVQSPARILAVALLLGIVVVSVIKRSSKKYPCPLPPSPPAEPFFGHYRNLPLENAHLTHMQYAKQFSKSNPSPNTLPHVTQGS